MRSCARLLLVGLLGSRDGLSAPKGKLHLPSAQESRLRYSLIYSYSANYQSPTLKQAPTIPPQATKPYTQTQLKCSYPLKRPIPLLTMQHTLLPPSPRQRLTIRTFPIRPPLTPIAYLPLLHAARARRVRDFEGDVFPCLRRMLRVSAGIVWELLRCGGVLGWRTRD